MHAPEVFVTACRCLFPPALTHEGGGQTSRNELRLGCPLCCGCQPVVEALPQVEQVIRYTRAEDSQVKWPVMDRCPERVLMAVLLQTTGHVRHRACSHLYVPATRSGGPGRPVACGVLCTSISWRFRGLRYLARGGCLKQIDKSSLLWRIDRYYWWMRLPRLGRRSFHSQTRGTRSSEIFFLHCKATERGTRIAFANCLSMSVLW